MLLFENEVIQARFLSLNATGETDGTSPKNQQVVVGISECVVHGWILELLLKFSSKPFKMGADF